MLKSQAIGRLTADPTLKTVNLGGQDVSVCEFSIAVNQKKGDKEETEYIDCVAWRGLGETIAKYTSKGRLLFVEGKQKTRKFNITKDNVEFEARRIEWILDTFEFLDSQSSSNQSSGATVSEAPAQKPYMATPAPF